jgi:hypothetical protein
MTNAASEIVITSEARNLLSFALKQFGKKQQIPHGLEAVRDDNLRDLQDFDAAWAARTSATMRHRPPCPTMSDI